MKQIDMFGLQRMTKRQLASMVEPVLVMVGPEKDRKPIAVLVPYNLFKEWQEMRADLGVKRFE